MAKTALPCNLAIAQKLSSKLLFLVNFHFKTLCHVLMPKPCHNINLADAAGCASHGGFLPTYSANALSDVVTISDKVITKFNDHNLFEIFKAHSMNMIASIDKETVMNQEWY